jgi:hypothetical protein
MPTEFQTSTPQTDAPTPTQRSRAVHVIALICFLTAILQIFAATTLMMDAHDRGLDAGLDFDTAARLFVPLLGTVVLYLAAGVATFFMRRESLAFLGCLLGWALMRQFDLPFKLHSAIDLAILLALVFFSIQLADKGKLR